MRPVPRNLERTGKLPVVVVDGVPGRDFYEKDSSSGDLLRTFYKWANEGRARVVLVVDGFALDLVSDQCEFYVRLQSKQLVRNAGFSLHRADLIYLSILDYSSGFWRILWRCMRPS